MNATEYVNCALCTDYLALPKSLNCGHTFCLECIQKFTKDGSVTCAVCREIIEPPNPYSNGTDVILKDDGISTPDMNSQNTKMESELSIKFERLTGDSFTLKGVRMTDKVEDIKRRLHLENIASDDIKMMYNGKLLMDNDNIGCYDIGKDEPILLIVRPKSGTE
ncbi:zinc finger of c3HC4-type, RING domain-containing protein [Ditylenchus destructor]|uniref:Zinc finger of c3HC4-type, RING domain-containing protein n=1 Tax=Ditylenchus destructor TaxID=166010 RepID=A0AAD4R0U5_9BILA|nr:zinc finger of c3HC4-type, RING domain-containing protein [Ditylenchus destructor]